MLQFVYSTDKDGILGYSYGDDNAERFARPIRTYESERFIQETIFKTILLMGGNTIRSILDERKAPYHNEIQAVFTKDETLIRFLRNEYPQIEWVHLSTQKSLLDFLNKHRRETVSCIGGPLLFDLLDGMESKQLVVEFNAESIATERVNELIFFPEARKNPQLKVQSYIPFSSMDQNGRMIDANFVEYIRA